MKIKDWLFIALTSLTWVSAPSITEAGLFDNSCSPICNSTPTCEAPCDTACGSSLFGSTSYFNVGGTVGRGYGCDPGHGTFGAFLSAPLCNCTWLPFVDVQAHILGNGRWAVNSGIGLRWMNQCRDRVWGANFFYDYRQVKHNDHFDQVGFGVESLGTTWDFRLNAYFPVGQETVWSKNHIYDDYVGNYVMSCKSFQCALKGFDTEVGMHMFRVCDLDFYAGLGTYYFTQHRKHAWGVQSRLLVQYGNYISIECRQTYDNLFHSKVQAVFNVMIPFDLLASLCSGGCNTCECNPCTYLISQPVQRNDLIIITDPECCWEWNF